MRKSLKIALASVLLLVILGAVALFGPLVRWRIRSEAEARGLKMAVGTVRPGLGRLWLSNLTVNMAEVPGLVVEVRSAEVEFSPGLHVVAIRGRGGSIRANGSPAKIAERVQRWKSQRPLGHEQREEAGTSPIYVFDGLDLSWEDDPDGSYRGYAWGLRYQRRSHGTEVIGADLVRFASKQASADIIRPELTLGREGRIRKIDRLIAASVNGRFEFGSTRSETSATPGIVAGGAPAPPEAAPSRPRERTRRAPLSSAVPSPSAPPIIASAEEPRPAGSGSQASDEQGKPSIVGFRFAHGPALRHGLRRLGGFIAEYFPEPGRLEFEQIHVEFAAGKERLGIGPAALSVWRAHDRAYASLSPSRAEQRSPMSLRLDFPLADGAVHVELDGGPVRLADLGIREGSLGLKEVDRAELEARAKLELSSDGRRVVFSASGQTRGLGLENKRLATETLRGIHVGWTGQGEAELDVGRLRVDQAELTLGNVHLAGKLELERAPSYTKIRLEGGVPIASCQELLDAVPSGLMPLLAGTKATGTFGLDALVEFDTRHLADTRVRWKMRDACRIVSYPEAISPRRFQQPWEREVLGADGEKATIESGPGTLAWVPRQGISRYMVTAVLICEDGGFFQHGGFSSDAISNSLRQNLNSGEFVRGASTISMQLAKNLYLARDKTVSRKLQEAVLTRLLEQELSKDQILELYLNVIEFGPGIYGIGPAAAFYFNAAPSELSLGQALYLGSILPNPKHQHFASNGEVSRGWSDYLRRLMRIALDRHLVTEQEYEQGLSEQVIFHTPASPRHQPGLLDLPPDSPGDEIPADDQLSEPSTSHSDETRAPRRVRFSRRPR